MLRADLGFDGVHCGSGHGHAGTYRAGYGVRVPGLAQMGFAGPLLGRCQSVQRAELRATCKNLELAPGRLQVLSDSASFFL